MLTILYILLSINLFFTCLVNVSKIKFRKQEVIIFFITSEVVSFILFNIIKVESLGTFFIYLLMLALIHQKTKSLSFGILFSTLATIIAMVSDNISLIVMIHVFDDFLSIVRENFRIYMINHVFSFLIAYAISRFLGNYINNKLSIFDLRLQRKFSTYIILGSLSTLGIFYTNIFFIDKLDTIIYNIILCLLLVFQFIYFITGIYMFTISEKHAAEVKYKQELLDNLKSYTTNIETLYTELRKFKHDYVNIISTIYGYIDSNDIQHLKVYFSDHIIPLHDKIATSNSTIDRLRFIESPELKGILSLKILHAQDIGIKVNIELSETIKITTFYIVDLCRVVGILFDNCIEECSNHSPSSISFVAFKKQGEILLIFSNTFSTTPELSKIFNMGYSTKGEGRGLGLYNLREITARYQNVLLETELSDHEFIQKLAIR